MKQEYLPLTYIKSKRGLWHIESSMDAKESGIHICSVTSEEIAKSIVDACNNYHPLVEFIATYGIYDQRGVSMMEDVSELI